jgi:phospholipase/carboxylesterase
MAPAIAPHGGQPVVAQGTPLKDARAAVIMVHGRNAAPKNILDLVPALAHQGVAYVAPAAAGGTWYPLSFMAPIGQNEPGVTSGIAMLHGLIDDIVAHGVPTGRIVLLGFSQGACLVSTAAQRRAARFGGVIVYSGGLIGPPGTMWPEQGSFAGTPVFLGCSDRDAHIPEERVRASAAVFERMGADVTLRIYEGMGHAVNDDEIAWTRALLDKVAAG